MPRYFHVFPYPDEELGSLVTRAQRRLGLPPKEFSMWFFGQDARRPLKMDNYLPFIAQHFGWSAGFLLLEHSLAPYALAGLPREEQLRKLQGWTAGMPSMPSRRIGPINLRWCPACLDDDINHYGESYWHRCHLLPGMLECPIHGTVLYEPAETLPSKTITTHRVLSYWLDDPLLPHQMTGRSIPISLPADLRRQVSVLSYLVLRGQRGLVQRRLTRTWHRDWAMLFGEAFLLYCGCSTTLAELPLTTSQILAQIAAGHPAADTNECQQRALLF